MENKSERYQKTMNILDVMENSSFGQLMKKGLSIHENNQHFSKIFPKEFLPFIRCGQINDNSLFIEVANSMVRQGILFQEKALVQKLQSIHPEIQRLNIKINPEFKR